MEKIRVGSTDVDEGDLTSVKVVMPPALVVTEVSASNLRLAACYLGQGWSMPLDLWRFRCLEAEPEQLNPLSWLSRTAVYYLYLLFHNTKFFRVGLLLAWCGLAFIEYPSWCFSAETSCYQVVVGANLTSIVPHFDLELRPPSTTLWIELSFIVCILLFQFLLKLSFIRSKDAFPWDWLLLGFLTISLIDTIVSLSVDRSWRISPWLRVFCLIFASATSRAAIRSTLSTIPYFLLILLILGLVLFTFSWAAILVITGPGAFPYFKVCLVDSLLTRFILTNIFNTPFFFLSVFLSFSFETEQDYITSVSSLQILMTTANFPVCQFCNNFISFFPHQLLIFN